MGRRLGQHFLWDPAILDRIVDALEPEPDDIVVEVGAGEGSLTRRLAPRVRAVIAVERDAALAAALNGREEGTGNGERESRRSPLPANVYVVEGDALELDWAELAHGAASPTERESTPRFKTVGNIPYYITSPLIDKALTPPGPASTVFLIQREVADRLVASPGTKEYGAISVGVRSVASVERMLLVRPGSFRPPPKVESAVVRLKPLERPLVNDGDRPEYRRLVTGLFSRRRKQLGRALRSMMGGSADEVRRLLTDLDLDPKSRPEALSPQQFARLFAVVPR